MVDKPHKDNAPGPFYVFDGCCTACDVPFAEAPGMFAYDEQYHCFVKKQPQTESDLNRMIRTVFTAELECIRYRGEDRDVLRRLAEGGRGHLADTPVFDFMPVSRNHVTFDAVDPIDRLLSETHFANEFQSYIQTNEHYIYKFTPILSDGERTSFSYSWFEDNFHPIQFSFVGGSPHRWLIVSEITFDIHDWLVADKRFCDIRWYTEEQWKTSKNWQETPF